MFKVILLFAFYAGAIGALCLEGVILSKSRKAPAWPWRIALWINAAIGYLSSAGIWVMYGLAAFGPR